MGGEVYGEVFFAVAVEVCGAWDLGEHVEELGLVDAVELDGEGFIGFVVVDFYEDGGFSDAE